MSDAKADLLGREARNLLRRATRAALATSMEDAPYASLVLAATGIDAAPLLLLSDLAEHAKNLKRDPRAALLIEGTAGLDEPLAGPRVTLIGTARRIEPAAAAALRMRYLARYPAAALYAGFKDFAFYRMEVARAHLVEGFGRIDWIAGGTFLCAAASWTEEAAALERVNADPGLATGLARPFGAAAWQIAGIDPEGVDLRAGSRLERRDFAEKAADLVAAEALLRALAGRA